MFTFKYQQIANLMLSASIFISAYSLATAAEKDVNAINDLRPSKAVHAVNVTVVDEINLLKNYISIKFEAQKNHRDHVLRYQNSERQAKIAIREVEELMWRKMKEKSTLFFKIHNYESCNLKDVLFIGALYDIFINRSTRNKAEQDEFLMMLEDSCRYVF